MPPVNRPVIVIEYDADGVTARIPLRRRDGTVKAHAIVDADIAEWLTQWYWCLSTLGYVVADRGRKRLQRIVMGDTASTGYGVDHINRDKLDNRRANLRVVTREENAQNVGSRPGTTSKYRNVCWNEARGLWMAALKANHQTYYLGHFESELEAAEVVRAARLRLMPGAVD